MQSHESNGPNQEVQSLSLSQYTKDPIAWCQRLINMGLAGKYGNPQMMMAIISRGSVLGLDPHTSLEAIYTVDGKTALGVDLMLALVERSGLLEDKRHKYTGKDETRQCTVWIKRINRTEQDYSFSIQEARQANIIKPGGGWTKYPDSMLYARAMSFGLRREFPDVLRGVHSIEEMRVEPEPPRVDPELYKIIEAEPEEPEEKENTEVQKPRRRRRTKAEMLAASQHEQFPSPVTDDNIDPDDKLAVLRAHAKNSRVTSDEVLGAAKALRLAFEETDISQIPEHKVNTLLDHWPAVLGAISREKAKHVQQAPVYE